MDAAASVLESMQTFNGRKIAVLGDMLELGKFTDNAHYSIGKRFVKAGSDMLLLLGSHSEQYEKGAIEAGMNPEQIIKFENTDKIAEYIDAMKMPGDIFLIKGSRAMGMEKILRKVFGGL